MEILIELPKTLQFTLKLLLRKNESGNTEVIGTRSLSKATSGNQGDTSVLEDFKAVKEIHTLMSQSFSRRDGLWREFDRGEGVHGTLHFLTVDVAHSIQSLRDQFGPIL